MNKTFPEKSTNFLSSTNFRNMFPRRLCGTKLQITNCLMLGAEENIATVKHSSHCDNDNFWTANISWQIVVFEKIKNDGVTLALKSTTNLAWSCKSYPFG